MKKVFLRLTAAAVLGLTLSSAQAVSISLQPSVTNADPGDSVSLDLVVSGLGDGTAPSVGDFDINVGFDTAALSFDGYSLGAGLGNIGLGEAFDFSGGDLGGGLINLSEVSFLENDANTCIFCVAPFLEDLQGDSLVLATLQFSVDVLPEGSSTVVSIANVLALGDGFGIALNVTDVNNATIRNPGMAVPEPGVLLLFGVGLVALVARKQRFVLNRK